MRVKSRKVASNRKLLALLALFLILFGLWNRRSDPVRTIINSRNAERSDISLIYEALELHAVRNAVCESLEAAQTEAARYKTRGAAGYIFLDEVWHVLCCGYETEEEARKVCDQLYQNDGLECDTVCLISERVPIHVRASKEQIEVLSESERKLRETETFILSLSVALDKGKLEQSQVPDLLESHLSQLRAVYDRFARKIGDNEGDEVCSPLFVLIKEEMSNLESLENEAKLSNRTMLSGRLRYYFLSCRIAHIAYLASLGG